MLLATDLDGTFLAGDPDNRLKLYRLVAAHPEIDLVFVTGRGLESVLPLLSDPTIPQPDYIICDVGCTVVHGETQQAIQPLQGEIDELWPGEQMIEDALLPFDGLQRQEVPQERRVSYFCDGDVVTDEMVARIEALSCNALFSNHKYLDILPRGVNKGRTLSRLVKHLNVDPESVLVAGDTLNDLSMYEHGFKGVCVGESEPDLLDATMHKARVLHAGATGCGGILEAFEHFGYLGHLGIEAEAPDYMNRGKSDLVIVYHRLPYEEVVENGELIRRRPKSPNGIIPTLLSFFADGKAGSWVAWSIDDPDLGPFQTHTEVDTDRYEKLVAARVPLSKDDVEIFYKRFSKEAFWPTLHTFWERATFHDDHWQVFLKVNKQFAERAAEEAAENAVVWIHDYNLWMVPAYLREIRPDLTIAFFHHTYFPSADVFNVLPWRREIVGSLLQCDHIGFHIPRQAENFVDVARGVTPLEVTQKAGCAPRFLTYGCAVGLDEMSTEIKVNDRKIGLGAHPVGLDLNRVRNALADQSVKERMEILREELMDVRLILSVERLDFTKGIIEKLDAYERMLNEHPELKTKVTLMMVCVPAAAGMTIYEELLSQIEQTVGRINGQFAQVGWTPVQFFFRALPFEELVSYYTMADVMWITPLRDGLNLVAKEYIATQGLTQGSGRLVLSEFAGAAAELRGAILANPHHPQDLADTCYYALAMSRSEAQNRLSEAFEVVSRYDIDYWGREFIDTAEQRRATKLKKILPIGHCAA
ncbi:glucosylglycerol-phosphate synthase [Marinobacter manganoxydans]|jgi:glucosylglycerol-phosphate synthase|uniref:Glucosylglycerol-phosphate synthase n=1 Tax=Marinobacter manganoxydans MnI7-9 TaxID=1094979 RepID=G6YSJ0_9GAMM|nr:glucosylglycerol-phosphate synthase [Marinobacter manganoxydans]EHJ04934.1 glucosylglycerol-phosphate synthase [Marinobacter manganoxydans MnI7-9]MBI46496.1 glucosylglycerol-phosphate synthase [Marinobacter sp.]|tara:strand:+ start:1553 stop:3826 length:2274 start_codon:yes stop_codon:yes gene_type:complete